MSEIPPLIDNETYMLKDAVRVFAKYSTEIKIATGYFRVSGFDLIKDDLKNLRLPSKSDGKVDSPFKIIMGPEVDTTTAEQLIEGYKKRLQEDISKLDLEKLSMLYEFVQSGLLDVHIETDKRFHSKAYIFKKLVDMPALPNVTIVGSSNFTYEGQTSNIELNVLDRTGFTIDPLDKWFDKHWQSSLEFREDLLRTIESDRRFPQVQATRLPYVYMPPEEFVKHLIITHGKEYLISGEEEKILLQFQLADYKQCRTIINEYGGVINASSVGLGKSFVTCEIMKNYLQQGKRILLIAPPHLLVEDQWIGYLRRFAISERDVTLLSMYELSQEDFDPSKYWDYDLVVVDEVHNFRNHESIRYQNLRKIKTRNTELVLLSATPINNSPEDLKNIIDIFLDEAKFRGLRGDLLKPYFGLVKYSRESKKYRKKDGITKPLLKTLQEAVRDLRKKLIVRTTRKDLRNSYGESMKLEGREITFYEPDLKILSYTLSGPEYQKLFEEIIRFIDDLELAHIKLLNPRAGRYLTAIYKHLIYKRLESSIYSFYASIENLQRTQAKFLRLLETHSLKELRDRAPEELRRELRHVFEEDRSLSEFLERGKPPSESERENYVKSIKSDMERVNEFIKLVGKLKIDIYRFQDDKLELLRKQIEKDPRKKIIFTQFIDTAEYLYENLKINRSLGHIRIVTGDIREKQPRIDSFRTDRNCKILVSTDILSEGVNIPEADIVVNYDLPWNPVKLIQRVGRVDRLGVNKQISVWNFNPDKNIDREIDLVRTLRVKINDIIQIIGTEYAVLSPEEIELIRLKEQDDIQLFKEKRRLILEAKWEELEGAGEKKQLDELDQLLISAIVKYGLTLDTLKGTRRVPVGKIPYTTLGSDKPGVLFFETLRLGQTPDALAQYTRQMVALEGEQPPSLSNIRFEEKKVRLSLEERLLVDRFADQADERKKQLLQERQTNVGAQRDIERIKGRIETNIAEQLATKGLTEQRKACAERVKQLLGEFVGREIPSSYVRTLQVFFRNWVADSKRILTDEFIEEFAGLVEELKRTAQTMVRPEEATLALQGFISLVKD